MMDFTDGISAYLKEFPKFDYKEKDLRCKLRLSDSQFEYCHRIKKASNEAKKREIEKELLDDDPSHSDNCGRSLLHKAVVNRDAELVRHLVEEGADIHCLDCVGNTPLHLACNPPNYDIAKLLCDAGANPMLHSTKECLQSPYSIIQGQLRRYSGLSKCRNEHSKLSHEKFKRLLKSSQMILEMFSRWRDASSEREITDRGLSVLFEEIDMLGLIESAKMRYSIDQELTTKVSCIEIAPSFTEWRQPHTECDFSLSNANRAPSVVAKPIDILNKSIGAISLCDSTSFLPTNNVNFCTRSSNNNTQ